MNKQELLDKIASRDLVCGTVGLGYVGLPLAVEKAKAGFTEVDLIPLIYSWNLEVQRDTMTLDAVLAAQNPGLNPELIRAAFCETYPDLQPDFVTFHRRAVLDGEGKEFR